ncbi:unnamed protein product [Malus baccata var. baccata]
METRRMRRTRKRQGRCSNRNSNLMDLNNYILVNIFSRLPAKSVCCIGCVSKTLSNIVDCPLFAKQQMRFLIATNAASNVPQPMVLMALQSLQYDGNSLEKSRHTIASQVIFRRHKYSFHLDFVFFNIICLKDGTDGCRCLLLNPLKGEAMMLPTMLPSVQVLENLNPKSFEYWYGMGFDNMTNTYKIVRYLVSHVYVLGTSSWKEIDSVPSREIIIDKKVSAYRDMHWLTLRSRRVQAVSGHSISILSFDFKKEKFSGCFPPVERFQLINLRGSLSLVDASSDKYLDIWMLKNYDEKGWILGYRIEGSTLGAESPYKVLGLECPVSKRGLDTSVLSSTGGLISIRSYGNLVEPKTSTRDLNAFTNIWKFD